MLPWPVLLLLLCTALACQQAVLHRGQTHGFVNQAPFVVDDQMSDTGLAISAVRVWHSFAAVQGIQVEYTGGVMGATNGYSSGAKQTLSVAAGEFINRIQLRVDATQITHIALSTASRIMQAGNKNSGSLYNETIAIGSALVGFDGTTGGRQSAITSLVFMFRSELPLVSGRFGDTGGTPFQEPPWVSDTSAHIDAVRAWTGLFLDSIQLETATGISRVGGNSGTEVSNYLQMAAGERIARISGWHGNGRIRYMEFTTTRQQSFSFGVQTGAYFSVDTALGTEFIGLRGSAGSFLDSVMLVYRCDPTNTAFPTLPTTVMATAPSSDVETPVSTLPGTTVPTAPVSNIETPVSTLPYSQRSSLQPTPGTAPSVTGMSTNAAELLQPFASFRTEYDVLVPWEWSDDRVQLLITLSSDTGVDVLVDSLPASLVSSLPFTFVSALTTPAPGAEVVAQVEVGDEAFTVLLSRMAEPNQQPLSVVFVLNLTSADALDSGSAQWRAQLLEEVAQLSSDASSTTQVEQLAVDSVLVSDPDSGGFQNVTVTIIISSISGGQDPGVIAKRLERLMQVHQEQPVVPDDFILSYQVPGVPVHLVPLHTGPPSPQPTEGDSTPSWYLLVVLLAVGLLLVVIVGSVWGRRRRMARLKRSATLPQDDSLEEGEAVFASQVPLSPSRPPHDTQRESAAQQRRIPEHVVMREELQRQRHAVSGAETTWQ